MVRKSTHPHRPPHPGTIAHLIPQTPVARKALQHQGNWNYVSHTEQGKKGLEIGYHVSRHSSANTITSLGREANLHVGDETVSRVCLKFCIDPDDLFVYLERVGSLLSEIIVSRPGNSDGIWTRTSIEQTEVLCPGEPLIIEIETDYTFKLVWLYGDIHSMKAKIHEEYRKISILPTYDTKPASQEARNKYVLRMKVGKGRPVVEVTNLRQALHPLNERRNRAVYSTVDEDTCQKIAVKEFCFVPGGSESWDTACNEYNIHASLQHDNIIPLLGEGSCGRSMQIYMLLADGALQDLAALGKVTETVSMHCVQDILSALDYLHEQDKICHRDVKPANILYTLTGDKKRPFKFYLADFGLATRDPLPGCVGTDGFIAPEVRRGDAYGCKADLWSLGTAIQSASGFRLARLDIMTREDTTMRASAAQALQILFSGAGLTTAPENIPILHDPPPFARPPLPRELERLRIDMNG